MEIFFKKKTQNTIALKNFTYANKYVILVILLYPRAPNRVGFCMKKLTFPYKIRLDFELCCIFLETYKGVGTKVNLNFRNLCFLFDESKTHEIIPQ